MRASGQVQPYIPSSAPLSYRLSNEVYSLDGLGNSCRCSMGEFGGMSTTTILIGLGALAVVGAFFMKGK